MGQSTRQCAMRHRWICVALSVIRHRPTFVNSSPALPCSYATSAWTCASTSLLMINGYQGNRTTHWAIRGLRESQGRFRRMPFTAVFAATRHRTTKCCRSKVVAFSAANAPMLSRMRSCKAGLHRRLSCAYTVVSTDPNMLRSTHVNRCVPGASNLPVGRGRASQSVQRAALDHVPRYRSLDIRAAVLDHRRFGVWPRAGRVIHRRGGNRANHQRATCDRRGQTGQPVPPPSSTGELIDVHGT